MEDRFGRLPGASGQVTRLVLASAPREVDAKLPSLDPEQFRGQMGSVYFFEGAVAGQ